MLVRGRILPASNQSTHVYTTHSNPIQLIFRITKPSSVSPLPQCSLLFSHLPVMYAPIPSLVSCYYKLPPKPKRPLPPGDPPIAPPTPTNSPPEVLPARDQRFGDDAEIVPGIFRVPTRLPREALDDDARGDCGRLPMLWCLRVDSERNCVRNGANCDEVSSGRVGRGVLGYGYGNGNGGLEHRMAMAMTLEEEEKGGSASFFNVVVVLKLLLPAGERGLSPVVPCCRSCLYPVGLIQFLPGNWNPGME